MTTQPDPTDAGERNLTVSLPVELHDALTQAANSRLISKSILAAFLLEDGLEHLVPVESLLRTRKRAARASADVDAPEQPTAPDIEA